MLCSGLNYIKTLLYMGVAILTGVQCRQKCLFGCTWLIQSRLIELGARGHAVLVKYLQTDHRRKLVISGSDFGIVDVISSAMLQSPHFICSFIFSISSIMFWGSCSGGQSFTLLIAQITYLTIEIYGPLSTWAQWNFGEIPAILHLNIFSYEI